MMGRKEFGPLRIELERALAVADRANNAVLQEQDGRWRSRAIRPKGRLSLRRVRPGCKMKR